MKLTESVKFIIDRLAASGYRADIVGGPVRDHLLGKTPSDYDLTTDAKPERVKEIFSDLRTVDIGMKHGTVALIIDGEQYEVTTYRIDGEYTDSRHPDSVSFTADIAEDLRRRDFTMNAIAYSPAYGITDPYGGERDIERRLIRAVGEPERRFTEDALRILRGARFAAVLGFEVEDATAEAMIRLSPLLKNVSAERIYTEWRKLLSGDCSYEVIEKFMPVIEVFLPELRRLALPPRESFLGCGYMARMISLFLSSGLSDPVSAFTAAMKRLRTDSHTAATGAAALSAIGEYDPSSSVGHALKKWGAEAILLAADAASALSEGRFYTRGEIEEYLSSGRPYRLSELAIGGAELLAIGFSGKRVGAELNGLLRRVIDGELENSAAALIKAAEAEI